VTAVEPKSKGVHFVTVHSFVLERYGEEAWASVFARLTPDDQDALAAVVAVGWYPTAFLLRVTDAAETELERPGAPFREALGRYGADHQFTIIHRLFLRVASPGYVVEKAGQLWGRFHDTGRWTVVRGPRSVSATLSGFVVHAGLCRALTAYVTRIFELVGAQDVSVEHRRCRARGDASCIFEGHWR
jgi:hypothetical protein